MYPALSCKNLYYFFSEMSSGSFHQQHRQAATITLNFMYTTYIFALIFWVPCIYVPYLSDQIVKWGRERQHRSKGMKDKSSSCVSENAKAMQRGLLVAEF
jgi:hypothetical protein